MTRRRFFLWIVTLSVTAVIAVALAGPAAATGGGGTLGPKSILQKAVQAQHRVSAAAKTRNESGGGGDEAGAIEQRAEFQQAIVAAPAEVAPPAGLAAATHAANALPTLGGKWQEVTNKPFLNDPVDRGEDYGAGFRYVTGRMTAVTAAGHLVYAGSASGGVWRSTNLGGKWHPVTSGLPRLAIGALATDPRDGSVWVGTGEANNASENQYGVGIYRLAPGSSHWSRVGGTELFGAGVHRISWIRGHIYAATSHGLYRRTVNDRPSTSWKAVLQPAGKQVYPPSSDVTDLIALPGTSGGKILAVVGWSGYSDPPATQYNGFYVGSGGRRSFQRVTPSGDIDATTIGRTTLSSSGGWLYAVISDTSTGDLRGQGAFVSRSGKPTGPWKRIADVDKLANSDSALGDSTSTYYPGVQADYNQYILADPKNRNHLYLQLEEVYESTNGGASWATIGPYYDIDITCQEAHGDPYDCPPTTHPDQHAGMIYRGDFWAGNDGGLWRRPTSWHRRGHWTDLNQTLHTLQEYSVAVGAVGKNLAYWAGVQDNGEPYTRTDMSRIEQAFLGDGGDTLVNAQDGNKAVEEYVYLDMYMTTDAAVRAFREISPSCLTATNPPTLCDPNPRFIAPIEKDVTNPDHWVAGGQYVWDDTKSWDTVCDSVSCDWKPVYDTGSGHQTTALAANGAVTYAAWCGPCNPGQKVAFQRGIATNYGGSWHNLSLGSQLPNRYITSLAVDHANPAHVYASVGSYSRRWIPDAGVGHVFESADGGATWRDVSQNLPDAPVYKVVIAGQQLVVGTEVGAFQLPTATGGEEAAFSVTQSQRDTWSRLGSGLPKVTVWDLAVAPDGSIVAGTHGRGTWQFRPKS
jgi:hypothetical protein